MSWKSVRIGVVIAVVVTAMSSVLTGQQRGERPWVVYRGGDGPGQGKNIVFLTGDEEYRSEESMPMLAKILAVRHGFRCTVLFAINKDSGEIDPLTVDNVPGLRALERADLMVMFFRFRELPDDQMKYIMDYTNSGKPIIALRTSTHPFNYTKRKDSPYAKWTWRNKAPGFEGGYGRQVLRRDLDQPLRRPQQREHARLRRRGHGGPSDRPGRREDVGSFGRLRPDDPARRLQAAGHGPGSVRHEARRPAQRRRRSRSRSPGPRATPARRATPHASSRPRWATAATSRTRTSGV
jgi:hypothetical protein